MSLTGPPCESIPMPAAGIESWITYMIGISGSELTNSRVEHTVFFGSPITLPLGRRDWADVMPERIWRRTGVFGGRKDTPLTV
jgi:hypothetical protein